MSEIYSQKDANETAISALIFRMNWIEECAATLGEEFVTDDHGKEHANTIKKLKELYSEHKEAQKAYDKLS